MHLFQLECRKYDIVQLQRTDLIKSCLSAWCLYILQLYLKARLSSFSLRRLTIHFTLSVESVTWHREKNLMFSRLNNFIMTRSLCTAVQNSVSDCPRRTESQNNVNLTSYWLNYGKKMSCIGQYDVKLTSNDIKMTLFCIMLEREFLIKRYL